MAHRAHVRRLYFRTKGEHSKLLRLACRARGRRGVVPLLPPPTPDAQLEMPRHPLGVQGAPPSPRAGRPVERLSRCADRADASRRGECPAKHLQPVRDHAQRRKRCGGQGRHRRSLASAPARDRAAIEGGPRRRRSRRSFSMCNTPILSPTPSARFGEFTSITAATTRMSLKTG